jgi:hypothetical protein
VTIHDIGDWSAGETIAYAAGLETLSETIC